MRAPAGSFATSSHRLGGTTPSCAPIAEAIQNNVRKIARFPTLLTRKNAFAAKPCLLDPDVFDLIHRAREKITIDYDEVGQFPRFERPFPILSEGDIRVIDRVKAQRLLAGNALFRMQRPLRPP